MEKYEINGKEFPIAGHARVVGEQGVFTGETILCVNIPMVSDYQWFLECLHSRLEHPETYQNVDNNVREMIEYCANWLREKTTLTHYEYFKEKFKICFDYIYGKEAIAV